jgi:HAD superfamily hydrolase (TIGR01490 family)
MTLAIFDLDNTLLSGDSDHGWGNFWVEKNIVDGKWYRELNEKFYEQYKRGTLDIIEYSAFSFEPLARHSMAELKVLHEQFMNTVILPMIGEKATDLVRFHKQQNHVLLIITATNSFITRPIADAFGIRYLLATEPKIKNGRYVNSIDGVPCFHKGKVIRLNDWVKRKGLDLGGSYFYSDSHNDIPLMELVDNPIAVDPDEKLAEVARQREWKIISLLD